MPIFKKLKILNIYDMIDLDLCKTIFRIKNQSAPKPMLCWYKTNEYTRNGIITPKYKTNLASKSFIVQAVTKWNTMSESLKSSKNISQLKKRYKQTSLEKY